MIYILGKKFYILVVHMWQLILKFQGRYFFLEIEAETILMGVVGFTQNIFDFIKQRIQEALETDTYQEKK